jgi:Raf kinase inhibitor-like YbhB/YbcL family protein
MEETIMTMTLYSPAFEQMHDIPAQHTCDGMNTSPPLYWSGIPHGAKSLALVVDDPDAPDPAAPQLTFVHWVLYNIPPESGGLEEDVAPDSLPPGTEVGLNDWQDKAWGGPCPPKGRHRYFFKLYALNSTLPHLKRPSKRALEEAMEGHVLAQAQLIGLYQRH